MDSQEPIFWDAGWLGCGELVMELHRRLKPLQPGSIVQVVAQDPGAVEDLPAWSRMTGHQLIFAVHPHYHFQRKP